MSTTTDQFTTTLSPEEVLDGFEALADEKGWKLKDRAEGQVEARTGLSLRTYGDQIELSAETLADGQTAVHVVCHTRQVIAWGSGEQVAEAIRERLARA